MRKLLAILLLLPVISLAQTAAPKKAAPKTNPAGPAPVVATPDKIQWGPAPAVFPAGAQFAVLAGDPTQTWPIRRSHQDSGRLPHHAALASHRGKCDRAFRRVPCGYGR